jgi:hypothetical protein
MADGTVLRSENAYVEGKFPLPDAMSTNKDTILIYLLVTGYERSQDNEGRCFKRWKLKCAERGELDVGKPSIAAVKIDCKGEVLNKTWEIDPTFIPPTFKVTEQNHIHTLISKTIHKIKQCIYYFPEVEEIDAHLKFHAVYQSLAKLAPYETTKWEFHPYVVYQSWVDILATVRGALEISGQITTNFPVYDHHNLTDTFGRLYQQTEECLEKIVLDKYGERKFKKYFDSKTQTTRYYVEMPPAKEYYLLSSSIWSSELLIGYKDEIESIREMRIPKITVQAEESGSVIKHRDGHLYVMVNDDDQKKLVNSEIKDLVITPVHEDTEDMPEKLILLFSRETPDELPEM